MLLVNNGNLPNEAVLSALHEKLDKTGQLKFALSNFDAISKNEGKVRFVLKLIEKHDLLPSPNLFKSQKNTLKATEARNAGNKYFGNGDYLNALNEYNRSLCYSMKGSENLGLAYANRSAVYFKTGYYETCLQNIELALENGYPEKMTAKLMKRHKDCLDAINNGGGEQVKPEEIEVKLSYKSNPKFPSMVDGIELIKNEKFGIHFVAKRNLNPGDILMVEKPLSSSLRKERVHMYCLYCLNSHLLNLFPCEESTNAMFCSKKCYNEAMEKFFKYESPVLDAAYAIFPANRSAFRLITKLITNFETMDDLKQAFDSLEFDDFNPNNVDFKNSTEQDLLLAFCSLRTYEDFYETGKLFFIATWSAYTFYLIKHYSGFGQHILSKEHEDSLMKIIYRLFLIEAIAGCRAYCVGSKSADFLQIKGGRLSLLTHFLNHSCAANVFRFGENFEIVAALRPIKAGDQLFMSYGPTHLCHTLAERQTWLKDGYSFNCTCVACLKNYSKWEDPSLEPENMILPPEIKKNLTQLPKIQIADANNKELLKNSVNKYSAFIKAYEEHYPDDFMFYAIENLKTCMILTYLKNALDLQFKEYFLLPQFE